MCRLQRAMRNGRAAATAAFVRHRDRPFKEKLKDRMCGVGRATRSAIVQAVMTAVLLRMISIVVPCPVTGN